MFQRFAVLTTITLAFAVSSAHARMIEGTCVAKARTAEFTFEKSKGGGTRVGGNGSVPFSHAAKGKAEVHDRMFKNDWPRLIKLACNEALQNARKEIVHKFPVADACKSVGGGRGTRVKAGKATYEWEVERKFAKDFHGKLEVPFADHRWHDCK